jgi:hypothetical protein
MQNIITKLQDIIRTHYGFPSELEWKPLSSQQTLLKETYSPIDQTLSIPIYEPRSGRPIAYFKVHNVEKDQELAREKLRDLVNLSLQSYVNLMDQLEVSEDLIQYLQVELHPEKVIRLKSKLPQPPTISPEEKIEDFELNLSKNKKTLLLKSHSPLKLERLALSIHAHQKNHFFLRADHMGPDFLNSMNDLVGLQKTTIYIPRIEALSERQQKTLETCLLMQESHDSSEVLFIAGTQVSLGELVHHEGLSKNLLKHFDFFYVLSDNTGDSEIQFESLNQCAQAILQNDPSQHLKHHKFSSYTKSCQLIPSCQNLFPTIH